MGRSGARGRLAGGVFAGLVLAGLVTGCTTGSGAEVSSGAVARPAIAPGAAPGGAASDGQAAAGGDASAGGGGGAAAQVPAEQVAAAGRQVIRTASVSLDVPDVAASVADARGIAASVGGYVGTENTQADSADLSLSVPSARLDAAVNRLAGLGTVVDRGAQSQDVTDQLVDVGSRLAAQQASVARVRTLLAKAASIADVVSIEGELTKREADLESLEQQRAELSAQVAMSTVTVHLARAVAVAAPVAGRHGFLGGLAAGWHSLLTVLGGVLVVLGALLPYLIGLGVPVALVWWLVRRRRAARPRPVAAAGPDAA